MTKNECPTASELALFIDGKANRRDRNRWVSHLDACLDCRTVLGEAASYVEMASAREAPEKKWVTLFRGFETPALVPAMTVLLLALVTGLVLTNHMSWFTSPIEHVSTATVTAQLFATPGASYSQHRWVSEERGLGFSPALGERERAFRAGVYLVDLRVALHENRLDETSSILDELEPLLPGEVLTSLGNAMAEAGRRPPTPLFADQLENEALGSLDAVFFPMGIWTESARLAAAANERSYFSSVVFTDGLRELVAHELPTPIASRLTAIDALATQSGVEPNLHELQRELRTLVLLN